MGLTACGNLQQWLTTAHKAVGIVFASAVSRKAASAFFVLRSKKYMPQVLLVDSSRA
jgi:hypothetical protein